MSFQQHHTGRPTGLEKEAGRPVMFISVHPGSVLTGMNAVGVLSPEASADALLSLLERLPLESSGRFFSYTGEALPW